MQSNIIADIELLEETTSETTGTATAATECLLGSNKQVASNWIEEILCTIRPDNIKTKHSSMSTKSWIKSVNRHGTIKYTCNEKNPTTGNERIVIKLFAEWDQQQQLHPTYNGPRAGNYLKRLKSNYQALVKTIEFYQQDYRLVNVAGLKFELNKLYQEQRKALREICKIDKNMIVRAASTDRGAINDFYINHERSLELIRRFNESAILKIQQAHYQTPAKEAILKKVKEMEITVVKSDEENPLHTDLIHIFPIVHNHKTIYGHSEQKVYWYLSTTIPLGTIYPTAYRELGEKGVANFRQHLLCRINGEIKTDDFTKTTLSALTQIVRHSSLFAIYEQDLVKRKDSHFEMIKRVNQQLAKSHDLKSLEDGTVAKLKVMTLMLMTPFSGETLNTGFIKLFTPLLRKIPHVETKGILDADYNIQLRGNESEVNQVGKSHQAISVNPPIEINVAETDENSKTIIVQREANNPFFQLPVNLETTPVIKHVTKLFNASAFLHSMVKAINHEGYFKLEQLFLQRLQTRIININPNKKHQSQLDNLLIQYTEQVNNYTAEFKLIYEQQEHKDYKKLTITRQKIYRKFDPVFTELRNMLINQLGQIEILEDRKFASILIEFINVQKTFANLLYDKTYSGQVAYDMMSRLAVIANWLDYYLEIFCKSSKDRSGMLTLLIESFEIFYDILGHYPQLDNGNDAIWLQKILNSSVVFYSTSKVVASLNSPGSEGLNQSHVPFLQEHTRDYLHSIGKLSKKTWEIKFGKSDPYADNRKPATENKFLQDTNQLIKQFIADIKPENDFTEAINQTNTELEALIKVAKYSQEIKLGQMKAKLPQLKQRLISAIDKFHAKTEDANQAFENKFTELRDRLISARYYSSNKAIFAGLDPTKACQPEFTAQLKQLLAHINELRANNQSHEQNNKAMLQLNYRLALMVNILTHYKNKIREELEGINHEESKTISIWDADLANYQAKLDSLTTSSLEDYELSKEADDQSEQEFADTAPLLIDFTEDEDTNQEVVTEQTITPQERIEEYIKETIRNSDMLRSKPNMKMKEIDKLLKYVDQLRQILITNWELRKFKQESFLLRIAITSFIKRLPAKAEIENDETFKAWHDNMQLWADAQQWTINKLKSIDENNIAALTNTKSLPEVKLCLQGISKSFLDFKKEMLKSDDLVFKPYLSCAALDPELLELRIAKSANFLLPEMTLKLKLALNNFAAILAKVEQKKQQNQLFSASERHEFNRARATLDQLMTPLLQGQLPLDQQLFKLKQQVNKLLEQACALDNQEDENVKVLIEKLSKLKLDLIHFNPEDYFMANPELRIIELEEEITLLTNKLSQLAKENVQQSNSAVETTQQRLKEISQHLQTLNQKVEVLAKLADGSYSQEQIAEALEQIAPKQQQTTLQL